jgi:hypothetical protein
MVPGRPRRDLQVRMRRGRGGQCTQFRASRASVRQNDGGDAQLGIAASAHTSTLRTEHSPSSNTVELFLTSTWRRSPGAPHNPRLRFLEIQLSGYRVDLKVSDCPTPRLWGCIMHDYRPHQSHPRVPQAHGLDLGRRFQTRAPQANHARAGACMRLIHHPGRCEEQQQRQQDQRPAQASAGGRVCPM